MKVATVERAELTNVVASPTERSAKSAQEREVILVELRGIQPGPEGQVRRYMPEDKETIRGMKMRISRAAKSGGITDVRYGVHKDGGLLVWREAKAARKPKNGSAGEVTPPSGDANVAGPKQASRV